MAIRSFLCGSMLSASARSPLRPMCFLSSTLSGVKMRTLRRPREMLTYHCCELVAARSGGRDQRSCLACDDNLRVTHLRHLTQERVQFAVE